VGALAHHLVDSGQEHSLAGIVHPFFIVEVGAGCDVGLEVVKSEILEVGNQVLGDVVRIKVVAALVPVGYENRRIGNNPLVFVERAKESVVIEGEAGD